MAITAIDLFCGAGGLTQGLINSGIEVRAGFDLDPSPQYAYEENNKAEFVLRDIEKTSKQDINNIFAGADVRLLAGCAPCQPFSSYSQGPKAKLDDDRWKLLNKFVSLVEDCKPELVTMENVTGLRRHDVFSSFVKRLLACGYYVNTNITYGPAYGLPQTRKRLVILASRFGWPELTLDRSQFNSNQLFGLS